MKLKTEHHKFVYSEPVERALDFLEDLKLEDEQQEQELINAIEQFNTALGIIEFDQKDIVGLRRQLDSYVRQIHQKDDEIAELVYELEDLA